MRETETSAPMSRWRSVVVAVTGAPTASSAQSMQQLLGSLRSATFHPHCGHMAIHQHLLWSMAAGHDN
jgi:hypothetical protein